MSRRQQWVFLLTTGLFWFAMYTYPVLLSNHVSDNLGATPAMAGMVVGSYGFTQMLLRIPLGYLSDRLRRRKPFLIVGTLCTLLAALGLYLAKTPATALLARGMAGVAASTWVCFTVLYASGQAPELRAQAMGTLSSAMYAAQLIATLLGGALARERGVRASFLLAAAIGVIALCISTRVKDIPPGVQPLTLPAVAKVFQNRLLLYCSLLSILMQMISWSTLYGFSPGWAEQVLGADAAQLGLLSTVYLIPTILFSKLGASVIAPRIGEKGTVLAGFVCIAASCLLLPLTNAFWQMLCLQALCGVGVGCVSPILLALCSRDIAPAYQGIGMGTYQSLYGIGMFIGPLLAGWLVQAVSGGVDMAAGYRAVFLAAGGIAVLGAVLACRLPRGKGARA